MDPQLAFVKTDKGVEEIETRRHRLDHRMRALLLVVDGRKTVEQLMRDFARFGDVRALLAKLVSDGFIRTERPFRELRLDVANTIYEALGPDSNALTQEVENCPTLAALREYVAARRGLFETALGRERAERLWSRLSILLA